MIERNLKQFFIHNIQINIYLGNLPNLLCIDFVSYLSIYKFICMNYVDQTIFVRCNNKYIEWIQIYVFIDSRSLKRL